MCLLELKDHLGDADEIYVGRGTHLKRTSVHGRGRSGVRLRYRSHLTVCSSCKIRSILAVLHSGICSS